MTSKPCWPPDGPFLGVLPVKEKANMIEKSIPIEDLTRNHPKSVRFLMIKGIRCLACGEPIWGTLESAAKEKGFTDEQIDELVAELNEGLNSEEKG
jgi:hypothetical protein